MDNFKSFDSLEQAMDYMETQRMAASEAMTPSQAALLDGQEHWYFSMYGDLYICGHIPAVEDVIATERMYYDKVMDDEEQAEFDYIVHGIKERASRGFVYVRAYSRIEPTGELGSVHVVNLLPITKQSFDEFIVNGFRVGQRTPTLMIDIMESYNKVADGQ
jgi:hypothetical protein